MATGGCAVRAGRKRNTQPHGILIVIDTFLDDTLNQAAGRPLVPEHLPAAAPVVRLAGEYCFLQSLAVYVAQEFAARDPLIGVTSRRALP